MYTRLLDRRVTHPLEFIPDECRKRIFLTFLLLTLMLFGIFRILDVPLRTAAAPNGIVSFELAGTVEKAVGILSSWNERSNPMGAYFELMVYPTPLYAAFGLGLDYLFMPMYAFALAFGTLLATSKHRGWLKSLGAVAGYGAFVAAVFDAAENYALFQILLGKVFSLYPEVAFYCALIKFILLIFGLMIAVFGGLLPKSQA